MTTNDQHRSGKSYDWAGFYRALCAKGPSLLSGIDEALRDEISLCAESTDDFWSEELETFLAMGAVEGDLRQGVIDSLRRWRDNVAAALEDHPFAEIDQGALHLDLESEAAQQVVRELERAATTGC